MSIIVPACRKHYISKRRTTRDNLINVREKTYKIVDTEVLDAELKEALLIGLRDLLHLL